MLVSRDIMLSLMLDAGKDRINRAKRYKEEGRVDIDKIEYENSRNFEVSANVYGNETYRTYISARNGEIDDITCTCPDYERTYGVCKHTLATIMELEEIISPDEVNKPKSNNIRYTNFKQIVNTFYNEEIDKIDEEEIKITVSAYDKYDFINIDYLKSCLTEKEYEIIMLLFYYDYSVAEIAEAKKISRQAVNQTKLIAINKLRKSYKMMQKI